MRLLTQPNNLARGTSRNTNDWGTVANSVSTNRVTIPINSTKPTEFYRMIFRKLKRPYCRVVFTVDSPLFGDGVTQPVAAAERFTQRCEPACRGILSPCRRPTFLRVL